MRPGCGCLVVIKKKKCVPLRFCGSLLCLLLLTASAARPQSTGSGKTPPEVTPTDAGAPALDEKEQRGFFARFAHAYLDDWKGTEASAPEPARRGFPAPESSPPFPFSDWPYGGS